MIRPRIILALFRKDLVDALRESRVLISLLTPIAVALLYNAIFPEAGVFEAKVAYAGPQDSAIVQMLQARAGDGQTVSLKLRHVETADEARRLVTSKEVDVAFILPAGVDEAIKAGRAPSITVIEGQAVSSAASWTESNLAASARAYAGQPPAAVIVPETVKTGSIDQGVMGEMGPRRYFVLATVVMMLGMIAMLAVPIMLTEEAEKKTLDALLLVSSYNEVIAAKALVGLAYAAVSVTVMLGLTRLRPADLATFIAGTALLGLALIAIGLLLGGLFRSAQQVYSWSSVLLIPVIGPAFAVGLPIPEALNTVLKVLPTSQGMRILVNGLVGRSVFGDIWLSYVVTAAWAAGALALLAWRLSRRES